MENNPLSMGEGEFGKAYTGRNKYQNESMDELYIKDFGVTRGEMNRRFMGNLDKSIKILEIGCNSGNQLLELSHMGFNNLSAVEINDCAIRLARKVIPSANIVKGTIFDIPFEDNSFDMVFTSRVLIHINPDNIQKALQEIYRCSRKYIWGFEYFNPEYLEVNYRGHNNLLWKTDFVAYYSWLFSKLKIIKREKFKYLYNNNVDEMYLLEKSSRNILTKQ